MHRASLLRSALVHAVVLPTAAGPNLQVYESPYYLIQSDLGREEVREATIRITRAAEEYNRRTSAFAGKINRTLPFLLFAREEDYLAAGGLPGSAGLYTGDRLMAFVGATRAAAWRTVQHEGFHQFVDAVIGGDLPVWVNEGLAEYFGEALFTGDGMVTGVIPPARLKRIKRGLKRREFLPFERFMTVARESWNARMSGGDYDQAWSMVHFLAHGDGGRYDRAFNGFLRMVSQSRPWRLAWTKHFGDDIGAFEARWREYWLGLPDEPTAERYATAVVSVLTSFLARAVSQGQGFDSLEAFTLAAGSGLTCPPDDWLPPSLLVDAVKDMPRYGRWTLDREVPDQPQIVCVMNEGTRLEGQYRIRNGRVAGVSVEVSPP